MKYKTNKNFFSIKIFSLIFFLLITSTTHAGLYFYHTNHLDTPTAISDVSGNVVWKATYKPFGEAIVDTSVSHMKNNLRFPGQYYDEESGNHYNYFRDYNPSLGRYMQSDPIGLNGGINTFSYGLNNPNKYIDPEGLLSLLGTGVRGATVPPVGGPSDSISNDSSSPSDGSSYTKPRGRFGRPNGRGRYECFIKCDRVDIKGPGQGKGADVCTTDESPYVLGHGLGSSPTEAWNNAWDAASANTPRGSTKRHCRGVSGDCKNWKGSKR